MLHLSRDPFPGTPGTLRVISGIFFMYNFIVRLSGNKGTSARSARKIFSNISGTPTRERPDRVWPVPAFLGLGEIRGGWAFGRLTGTGKAGLLRNRKAPPVPAETRGLAGSRGRGAAGAPGIESVW